MGTMDELIAQQGFDCVGTCQASEVTVLEDVRSMCAADRCQQYDASWACPPACGDIYDFERQMHEFEYCTVLQTVGQLEDDFDVETMMEAEQTQKDRIYGLIDAIDEAGLSAEVMVLSSGTCRLCPSCTYPDEPCRFPDKRLVSMEAAGLYVSETCTKAGIPYNHGKNTIAYSGCVFYN